MKALDDMTPAEFGDLKSRFMQGKLKADEMTALRFEASRLLSSPMTMVSDDYREQLQALERYFAGGA